MRMDANVYDDIQLTLRNLSFVINIFLIISIGAPDLKFQAIDIGYCALLIC